MLEGWRLYELQRGHSLQDVRAARERGHEFLLIHRLFPSHRSGRVIKPEFKRFSFPPRWHYDVLRALDYFQAVHAPRDERFAEARDILVSNGVEGEVCFTRPELPLGLRELRIHNLNVAGATLALLLVRHERDVSVNVLRREGEVRVSVEK